MPRGRPSTKRKLGDVRQNHEASGLDSSHPHADTQIPVPLLNDFAREYDAGIHILDQTPEDGLQAKKKKRKVCDAVSHIKYMTLKPALIHFGQNDALTAWLPYRNEYLDEMMQLEGSRSLSLSLSCQNPKCSTPSSNESTVFRCNDCFQCLLMCRLCCLRQHAHLPFHRITVRCGFIVFVAHI